MLFVAGSIQPYIMKKVTSLVLARWTRWPNFFFPNRIVKESLGHVTPSNWMERLLELCVRSDCLIADPIQLANLRAVSVSCVGHPYIILSSIHERNRRSGWRDCVGLIRPQLLVLLVR